MQLMQFKLLPNVDNFSYRPSKLLKDPKNNII